MKKNIKFGKLMTMEMQEKITETLKKLKNKNNWNILRKVII